MKHSGYSVIIADMHLCHNRQLDDVQRDFILSLKECRQVFLLGDIFNFYFPGGGKLPDSFREFFSIMHELSLHTEIYYMKGNHDLWKSGEWKAAGVREIASPHVCELYGKKIIMMHGDELFKHEMHNRHIRSILSNTVNMELFSLIPHKWAYGLGAYVASNFEINADTDEVIAHAHMLAKNQMGRYDCDMLLMGHIHKQFVSKEMDFAITGPFVKGFYLHMDNKGVRGEHIQIHQSQ